MSVKDKRIVKANDRQGRKAKKILHFTLKLPRTKSVFEFTTKFKILIKTLGSFFIFPL